MIGSSPGYMAWVLDAGWDGVNYDYCEQLEIGDEPQSSDLMQLHQPLTHRIGPSASGPQPGPGWAGGSNEVYKKRFRPRHVTRHTTCNFGLSPGGADQTRVVT